MPWFRIQVLGQQIGSWYSAPNVNAAKHIAVNNILKLLDLSVVEAKQLSGPISGAPGHPLTRTHKTALLGIIQTQRHKGGT